MTRPFRLSSMINGITVLHVLALVVLIAGSFLIFPLAVALIYREPACVQALAITLAGVLLTSGSLYLLTRRKRDFQFTARDGFLLVSLSWVTISAAGALPFFLTGAIPSYTEAFFETMSGFTTTGASILTDIEALPRSLLFWRSLSHWLGGMGIVVLTVAILPLLGIGGLPLIQAESPGPRVDKLVPKVTETAKILWLIYFSLTILETLLLMAGGMDLFDALTHTFGTLATGGFSPKAASVGHYDSAYIDGVITLFMLMAGVNFGLYFSLIRRKHQTLRKNTELKAYLIIFAGASALITFSLLGTAYSSLGEAVRYAGFQAASILTTTGYATADFDAWPTLAKGVLFALMFVGGSSGSTGGGIKVIRIVTLLKVSWNEMRYLMHPRGIHRPRLNGQPINKGMVYTIIGFFFLYLLLLMIITLAVAASGFELLTSFSTALVTLGNIGPGFAKVGPTMNYHFLPDHLKWLLSLAMMVGRLEVYTVLIIFTPRFWRK